LPDVADLPLNRDEALEVLRQLGDALREIRRLCGRRSGGS